IASRLRTFGAESRSSVVKTCPSSSNLVRAAAGRTAQALVVTVDENARLEIATLRSLMGAPPRAGLEQRLRRERPERPGGCVKSPIALRFAKHGAQYRVVEPECKASFLRLVLENLISCGASQTGLVSAGYVVPSRPADCYGRRIACSPAMPSLS